MRYLAFRSGAAVRVFGALIAGLILTSAASAQGRPRMPYVDKGACPFECCSYREWTVDADTALRKAPSSNSAVIFRLKKGQRARGLTGNVITTNPGIARVTSPMQIGRHKAPTGSRVYLLTYQGEGYFKIWYRGEIISDEMDGDPLKLEKEPKAVWWVKVRDRRGRIGWSDKPENFGNKDECGY